MTTENGTVINTTENHPFYVEGKGWCAAAELEAGDVLRTQDGETEVVSDVEVEQLEEAVKVYNLEIEDSHTYYVLADEVLVHTFLVAMDGGEWISEKYRFDIVDKENASIINKEIALHEEFFDYLCKKHDGDPFRQL